MDTAQKKSKKKLYITLSVILAVALLLSVAAVIFSTTPHFALLCTAYDLSTKGLEGVRPHLTGDALRDFDDIKELSEDELVSSILELVGQDEHSTKMKKYLPEMSWSLKSITKNGSKTDVTLEFNYKDKFVGEIGLHMGKVSGKWKIERFEILDVSKNEE